MRVFLDINVILDVLTKREPWFADSAAVLSLLESDEVEGVAAAPQDTILKGLALGWSDLEDALQMPCAMTANADYLVTRNTDDFKTASLPVVTPTELLALLRSDVEPGDRPPTTPRPGGG